jgi:hypothetical protein
MANNSTDDSQLSTPVRRDVARFLELQYLINLALVGKPTYRKNKI